MIRLTLAETAAILVSAAALVSTTVVAVAHAAPEWTATAGLDFWNLPGLEAEQRAEAARSDDLDRHYEAAVACSETSGVVVRKWIDGRLTLTEAVAELESANHQRPGFCEVLAPDAPAGTPCREVLAWYALRKARTILADDPSRATDLFPQLADEFRAEFGHDCQIPPLPAN